MAAARPLEATVLIRIGQGRASEVATFEVPLRAVVNNDVDKGFPGAVIEVDMVALHESLRAGLHELADSIPEPPPSAADRRSFLGDWKGDE